MTNHLLKTWKIFVIYEIVINTQDYWGVKIMDDLWSQDGDHRWVTIHFPTLVLVDSDLDWTSLDKLSCSSEDAEDDDDDDDDDDDRDEVVGCEDSSQALLLSLKVTWSWRSSCNRKQQLDILDIIDIVMKCIVTDGHRMFKFIILNQMSTRQISTEISINKCKVTFNNMHASFLVCK